MVMTFWLAQGNRGGLFLSWTMRWWIFDFVARVCLPSRHGWTDRCHGIPCLPVGEYWLLWEGLGPAGSLRQGWSSWGGADAAARIVTLAGVPSRLPASGERSSGVLATKHS